jgi:hypothetical protein
MAPSGLELGDAYVTPQPFPRYSYRRSMPLPWRWRRPLQRVVGPQTVARLPLLVRPPHSGQHPFQQRLVEYAMASAHMKNEFRVPAKPIPFGERKQPFA